jgi:hypothetical protein
MSWTLCTSGQAVVKVGLYANSTISASGVALASWSNEAEGMIVGVTRRDWVDDYATADAHIKYILQQTASASIAKEIIQYDMSGYTSRAEAQTMLNVQDDIIKSNLKILQDFKANEIVDL